MLKLDMGGHVVPGSCWVEKYPEPGTCIVFAEIENCDAYPNERITWSIATSPHFEVAELIAEAIERKARGHQLERKRHTLRRLTPKL